MKRMARTAVLIATALACLSGPSHVEAPKPPQVHVAPPPPATVIRESHPVGAPTRLSIPAIRVDERLHGVGLKPHGAMQTPDFGDAGWYDLGPRPGAVGPAVIVAHVHGPAGDDVFARLHELTPGDRVSVRRTDGASTFTVVSVERARKDDLPYDRIWGEVDRPVLRLITCGGRPDPVTRMYPDNTIVYAELTR